MGNLFGRTGLAERIVSGEPLSRPKPLLLSGASDGADTLWGAAAIGADHDVAHFLAAENEPSDVARREQARRGSVAATYSCRRHRRPSPPPKRLWCAALRSIPVVHPPSLCAARPNLYAHTRAARDDDAAAGRRDRAAAQAARRRPERRRGDARRGRRARRAEHVRSARCFPQCATERKRHARPVKTRVCASPRQILLEPQLLPSAARGGCLRRMLPPGRGSAYR